MIPSALAGQLHQGLADFLGFSFWSSTPGMEGVVERLLAEPGALVKGPYVSLKLPFVRGHNPRYLPNVPLDFPPYLHQEQAFERLGDERKLSTLVATGTGSGKTESFLLPILDHCLSQAGQRGVKAILIYPMNALATDQAGRIARWIHGNKKLRGRVTAGLYIGQDLRGPTIGETRMGPGTVITDRTTLQHTPPDVLLTNYKMLDYLLLRPRDQGIWRDNERGTLRFLVVDELHTFDGAQGTDLACLIRRLKRRLEVDDGSLCCVGTSATLGGSRAGADLRRYAGQVFGEPFDDGSVLGEHRLDQSQFLAGCRMEWITEPGADHKELMDPARAAAPGDWIDTQVRLWFPELKLGPAPPQESADGNGSAAHRAWAVALGEALKRHATFHALLDALGDSTLNLDDVAASLARQRSAWRHDPELARRSLLSLLGLVSAARSWRPELPEAAARREERGGPRSVQPFLEVRLQLWLRELTRMVATVEKNPRLRHSADLDEEARNRHLPLVHCRECGAMGWGTVVQRDKPHLLRSPLQDFYNAYFRKDSRVAFLFPREAVPEGDADWKLAPFEIDSETLVRVEPGERSEGPTFEVIRSDSVHSTARGPELSRDCPFCGARASLTIVGFRAATLTSVFIDQLFASPFNSDKKLLTFSDSVQDAAHRAGFFGARTWRTNLRVALLQVIREHEGLPLSELAETTARSWRQRMDEATWVSTFLAPDMAWLHDWETLKKTDELPTGSDLERLISRRLAYEVFSEFGLQAGIGRSLPRTGTATALPVPERLERAVHRLLEPLRNEVPGLRQVERCEVWCFVVGLLHHLRMRGGILSQQLPEEYLLSVGQSLFHPFQNDPALPGLGPSSRLPALLVDRTGTRSFDTWVGKGKGGWYARWVERCFGADRVFTADPESTYPVVLPILVAEGLLREERGRKGEGIWGLDETALQVSGHVAGMACDRCGHRVHVAEAEREAWLGMPCLTARCPGSYGADDIPERGYFGRLYASGDLQRVFTEEHTGLLGRGDRERIEREFKAQPGDDPDGHKPWYPNLLSCTSTLEMGIDIGDLSVAVLCSVPPEQANYLQRIGRTGRRDGSSLVLTVANARPHELFFFAEPTEMLAGDVEPPGVFLDAPAVLERQLTAFCFDRWVAVQGEAADVPPKLRTVFAHLDEPGTGHFPFSLISFVKERQPALLREFGEMFADAISADTARHLRDFMAGTDDGRPGLRWNLLEALRRERKQRDSLAGKANRIREQIKKLHAAEAQAADHEEQLDQLEREKDALLSLVAGINKRHTLEFLTEEGLLPNYAFPESAVRLSSVIWRQKKDPSSQGSKYETWSYEYKRSPAIALSELAPNADFYAGGRRVRIDQVDLGVSEVEEWRFCPECNHAQRIDTGDEAEACPACGTAGWRDTGQRFRLLKLQQVFANAPDRHSRIRDDKDDRQPRYFQRQTLVDVDDREREGAWSLDDERVPFGFEYLRRVTLREVNFGESEEHGARSTIAGQEGIRPGFQVCAQCGKVQKSDENTPEDSDKKARHALTCPARRGGEPRIEECLYLYREFASEALRMLLPIGDPGSTRELHSFVAALQVGLKALFGGSVDHLKTTVYSDPVEGSNLRRQYLVLFDAVPGGTGYLKQLVTPRSEGGEMPLFEAMEAAVERIEGCECWNDPDRDGCYRCLFAYRNSRDMEDTSARAASELLRRILERRGKLSTIRSLGEISISGLLDSVLEVRFVEALRRVSSQDGRQARLRPAVINQKPGYRWSLGDAEWVIEPQVNLAQEESGGIAVSIDFVARPATARSDRRLAVFLDGWTFHKGRIGRDLRQRMALLASGRWDVWTLTWADLDAKLLPDAGREIPELAVPHPERLKLLLQKMGLARYQEIAAGKTFDWLEAELTGDGLPWEDLAKAALAARMRRALPADTERWKSFVARVAPPAARPVLAAMPLVLVGSDLGTLHPLFELMAAQDGAAPALLCTLDDREEHWESDELRAAWQGYLRLFQLLRRLPDAWFMSWSGTEVGEAYAPIHASRSGPSEEASWSSAGEIEDAYRGLAGKLMQAGVREPMVGLDVPDGRGDAWAEAELVWEPECVAVTSRAAEASALRTPAADWVVLFVEDLGDDPEPVLRALERRHKVEET